MFIDYRFSCFPQSKYTLIHTNTHIFISWKRRNQGKNHWYFMIWQLKAGRWISLLNGHWRFGNWQLLRLIKRPKIPVADLRTSLGSTHTSWCNGTAKPGTFLPAPAILGPTFSSLFSYHPSSSQFQRENEFH